MTRPRARMRTRPCCYYLCYPFIGLPPAHDQLRPLMLAALPLPLVRLVRRTSRLGIVAALVMTVRSCVVNSGDVHRNSLSPSRNQNLTGSLISDRDSLSA